MNIKCLSVSLVTTLLVATCVYAQVRNFKPLETARPRPADFDEYWDGEIARQQREVPLDKAKVVMVELPDQAPNGFRLWDVTIPALDTVPVRGYLTIPVDAAEKSLPLYVRFGGAGTKSAGIAKYENAIAFSTNPNGCEQGRDEEYYKEFFNTVAKNYAQRGWYDREACFFHGQILRVVRTLEWAKTLSEWNGQDLAVQGKSMGGSQALQAAALDPDVTICAPEDPALCDHAGQLDETHPRMSGWPRLLNHFRAHPGEVPEGVTEEQILAVSDYFDNCFFAARIQPKCFTYFASGYCDATCPSEGVYIAYINKKGDKLLTVDPKANHCQTVNRPFELHWEQIRALPAK